MKTVKLTHPFLFRCTDRIGLLEECSLINTYINRLEKQAEKSMDENAYKGDGLELFTEALIKLSPIDKRIGIYNYERNTLNDHGVDGIGIGLNGKVACVQVKFRQANHVLTANNDHLSNFVMSANNEFGVDVKDKENLLIVTTANSLHHYTDHEMFGDKVRCLNREALRQLVDNNTFFWNSFRELWEEAILENKS